MKNMSIAVKHLILDVNVIIDLWLKENSVNETEAIFLEAQVGHVQLWVSASSLATLDYVTRRTFKNRGLPPKVVAELIPKLIEHLLGTVNILTNHGFEQLEVYRLAADFEDAQIAASARVLKGESVCVVTEDKNFDALGEVSCKNPAEAMAWLHEKNSHTSIATPIAFIDLASQQTAIRPQLERNIETVLRHGQYIMGPEVKELEDKLVNYTGAKHCITVASGTEALLIALMALGIKPGDEVITTPFSFIATVEVIVLLGATPIFVDIEPDTCNINAALIESKITAQTKVIMPVSLYGQPADMDEINAIAAKHGLTVIEDAAQSFGATYKGKKSCNLSIIGCTSFFPSKPLGCYGDGGAIFTSDDDLALAMREIRVHGQSKRYVHTRVGVGGRMDTIQCAIVLAKLERFDWEVEQRLKIGARYNELFLGKLVTVTQRSDRTSVFAQYTVKVEDREKIQDALKEVGIPTAVHYPVPMHLQPAYAHLCCAECCPVSVEMANKVMSLPMGAYLPVLQQHYVVQNLVAIEGSFL
jgi:UDP-2-acetamido-2-deoxy-ribo-hexuluronate aminotransferase